MKKISIPPSFEVQIGLWKDVVYPEGGESVAQVAKWNIEGTKRKSATGNNIDDVEQSIPPRDFLKFYWDRLRKESLELAIEITRKANRGENVDAAIDMIGINGRNIVMEAITDLKTPPNSAATIQRKGSSNPLIDTGLMRRSVTWKVTKK
jgi:hypothetical protein